MGVRNARCSESPPASNQPPRRSEICSFFSAFFVCGQVARQACRFFADARDTRRWRSFRDKRLFLGRLHEPDENKSTTLEAFRIDSACRLEINASRLPHFKWYNGKYSLVDPNKLAPFRPEGRRKTAANADGPQRRVGGALVTRRRRGGDRGPPQGPRGAPRRPRGREGHRVRRRRREREGAGGLLLYPGGREDAAGAGGEVALFGRGSAPPGRGKKWCGRERGRVWMAKENRVSVGWERVLFWR